MSLSDSWLKSNDGKARTAPIEKADRDGLSVRVSAKGKIKFQMRFYYNEKQQRCDIGTYPLMTLSDARVECQRYRAELDKGYDPRIVKLNERQAIINADSLGVLFELWFKAQCENKKASAGELRRSFEIHVLPTIGILKANEVTLHSWLTILESLAKDAPHIAARVLSNAKQMLKWAVKRRLIEYNVLSDISAKADLSIKKSIGQRSLDDDEIRLLFHAIENSRLSGKNTQLIKLLLFFGCRVGELRLAKKSDFDFEKMIWTVPPENHKTGQQTKKPLIRPIIPEIVPDIKTAMMFSNGQYLMSHRDEDRPAAESSHLSVPVNLIAWIEKHVKNKSGSPMVMEHWTVHDLRKTARTNWSSLCEPHIAEIMLGHKLAGVWQVYDHYQYLPEQTAAYKAWWERLERIRNPEKYQNVVEMKGYNHKIK